MAEISMVQMTGPAVSPGASAKEVQGSLVSDFSELLRDKGQSVSDGGKKTEVKRQETEQSQTHKPDKKVSVQEDEKQEANESASSPENTVLATTTVPLFDFSVVRQLPACALRVICRLESSAVVVFSMVTALSTPERNSPAAAAVGFPEFDVVCPERERPVCANDTELENIRRFSPP